MRGRALLSCFGLASGLLVAAILVGHGQARSELNGSVSSDDEPVAHKAAHTGLRGSQASAAEVCLFVRPACPCLALNATLRDQVPAPVVTGKLFDGWLHGNTVSHAARAKRRDADESATSDGSDGGGTRWYEREHLADPPAGWHRPGHHGHLASVASKTGAKVSAAHATRMHNLRKDETSEVVNDFRGKGADASPHEIQEEVAEDMKPFGNGKADDIGSAGLASTSIAQALHSKHRSIMQTLRDHPQGRALKIPMPT